jgi:hypothetical protein
MKSEEAQVKKKKNEDGQLKSQLSRTSHDPNPH